MAVLSMDSLPLGFRFRPTDEELIMHYLKLKINGRDSEVEVIPEIDVCKWEPWDLPGLSVIKTDDPEWFFFCPRDRKYPNGQRSNRATEAGYWKATGKDRTIRSRKQGSGNANTVGMKKTLVFYRGRAPKGERTNWIMHEYRPTLKELDGTAPGQGAFVLCRLFRKPEEKIDAGNYDEVEHTGYSPTVTKSSPDDASSDLVQETATPNTPVGNQSEGIQRWLTDRADDMIPNTAAPVDSSSNSHITSDIEDHGVEATAGTEYLLLEENSLLYESMSGQHDSELFQPMQSHSHSDPIYYMDSLYANDFGNDHNGFHCQDDTSEQEVSLTELLDEVFNNHDESSCEDSTSLKNLAVGNETQLPGLLTEGNFHIKPNSKYGDADTVMAQVQHDLLMGASIQQVQNPFGFGQAQASYFDKQLGMRNIGAVGNNLYGEDALSANSVIDASFGVSNSMEPANQINPVNYSSNVTGSGIKIRRRQSQAQPYSTSFAAQGTAPRRLKLQVDRSTGTNGNGQVRDASQNEDDEVQSVFKVARDGEEHTRTVSHEIQKESLPPNFDKGGEFTEAPSSRLRLRVKQDGESGSCQIWSSASADAPRMLRRASSVYIITISVVLIALVVIVAIWKCNMEMIRLTKLQCIFSS